MDTALMRLAFRSTIAALLATPLMLLGISTAGASPLSEKAMTVASRQAGKPYIFGSAGPRGFDCSGLVQYSYGRVGVHLPRTSRAQAAMTHNVSRSQARRGDLVIFRTGGRVTHVGLYAGHNTMWVARHSGTRVTRQAIYGSATIGRFGR